MMFAAVAYATNCTLSGQVLNVDGTPCANCTITLNPVTQQPLTTGGTSYSSQPVSTTTDSNGNMTALSLPQGLIVNVTISENGATFGGYTAIVPFMASATFVQMAQGISTQSLNALASSQPATGPVDLNGQKLTNVGCPTVSGDAVVDGCPNTIGPVSLSGDISFGGYSALNLGGVTLTQQPAPTNVSITSACTGTCSTSYSYQATCVNAVGETTGSTTLSANNAASLGGGNTITLSWPDIPAGCSQGYNIYGRSGTLHFLTNVPAGTTSWTDDGTITAADSYTLGFGTATPYSIAMWDMSGALNTSPINVFNSLGSQGGTQTVNSVTTTINNSTQFPIIATYSGSGSLSPPAGFTHAVNIAATVNGNPGLWGAIKNISTAGATGNSTSTTTGTFAWATMDIAISPANSGTPITIGNTLAQHSTTATNSFTVGDPASTSPGDLILACVSYNNLAGIVAPSSFNYIGSAAFGTNSTRVACYWLLPTGGSGPTVPAINTTGAIVQSTATGNPNRIIVAGLTDWQASTASMVAINGSSIISSISYPTQMTVIGCRATWTDLSCSGYPTMAIEDSTGSTVLCSSGTTSNTSTDKNVAPATFTLPANDVMAFIPSSAGTSCTTGSVSMSVTLHQ